MNAYKHSMRFTATIALIVSTVSGCGSLPSRSSVTAYHPTTRTDSDSQHVTGTVRYSDGPATHVTSTTDLQIESGKPNRFVDGLGNIFGIPEKILLWDLRAENHRISDGTEAAARRYLADNQLTHTKVRLNQYAPGSEWRRLQDNKQVGAGWRYTVGALSVLGYTVLPGRIFGGDAYNPFTDSIYLYSDIPSVAIHEAAYAHDSANRRFKGTYGTLQMIDGVNIWHETIATRDALDYVAHNGSQALQEEANRVLYPNYGKTVGGSAGSYVDGLSLPLALAGAAAGHISGRLKNHRSETTLPSAVAAVE